MALDLTTRIKQHHEFLQELYAQKKENPTAHGSDELRARAEAVEAIWRAAESTPSDNALWNTLTHAAPALRSDVLNLDLMRQLPDILQAAPNAPSVNYLARTRTLARALTENYAQASQWPETDAVLQAHKAQSSGQGHAR